ncbi:hypothetical protein PLIP_a0511 [Pseudoalteromonas lipolytica LMEB 39]|nr:hypothetical protein [Pseudoalteromonas lipolytica LMEB 39]
MLLFYIFPIKIQQIIILANLAAKIVQLFSQWLKVSIKSL